MFSSSWQGNGQFHKESLAKSRELWEDFLSLTDKEGWGGDGGGRRWVQQPSLTSGATEDGETEEETRGTGSTG